jgi:hypothetical protein
MKTANTIQTATPFYSKFFKTYCLILEDGRIVFSVTGTSQVINNNTGGSAIQGIRKAIAKIDGPQSPVVARDPSDSPKILTVLVDNGHMAQEAQAITQETFIKVLKEYKGRKTIGGKNAERIHDNLVGFSIDLILRKEAGLVSEETTREIDEKFAKWFKDTPGNEPADPVTKLKAPLIANGQKDNCAAMGILVNEFVYNRLPVDAYDEMVKRCGGHRRVAFKTNWQTLSTAAQERLEYIIQIALAFIEVETADGPVFNWAPVIQKLDLLLPRHRTSGYCPILTDK